MVCYALSFKIYNSSFYSYCVIERHDYCKGVITCDVSMNDWIQLLFMICMYLECNDYLEILYLTIYCFCSHMIVIKFCV